MHALPSHAFAWHQQADESLVRESGDVEDTRRETSAVNSAILRHGRTAQPCRGRPGRGEVIQQVEACAFRRGVNAARHRQFARAQCKRQHYLGLFSVQHRYDRQRALCTVDSLRFPFHTFPPLLPTLEPTCLHQASWCSRRCLLILDREEPQGRKTQQQPPSPHREESAESSVGSQYRLVNHMASAATAFPSWLRCQV